METKNCEYCEKVATYTLNESCYGEVVGYVCDSCEIDSMDYFTEAL